MYHEIVFLIGPKKSFWKLQCTIKFGNNSHVIVCLILKLLFHKWYFVSNYYFYCHYISNDQAHPSFKLSNLTVSLKFTFIVYRLLTHVFYIMSSMYIQECNQNFFRAEEISWIKDTSINISSTIHNKKQYITKNNT